MVVKKADVLLVGGGVMSATLGVMLSQLDPSLKIIMVERLDHVAHESTHGWNNAGTGHAGNCELNYTPQNTDRSVDIERALEINASFEVTLQLWSYLVENKLLPTPSKFINPIPHLSFVWGDENVDFLHKRYEKMSAHHLFKGMEFSRDPETLKQWMPLAMGARDSTQSIAATRVKHGSDVDFGSLTRHMVDNLHSHPNFELMLSSTVKKIKKKEDRSWSVRVKNRHTKECSKISADFVFLGAGGGALPLLQKSKIPERKGYGGFPVSGQWLVCSKPEIVKQHGSKVYGKAAIGAPPMSVPHLDTRIIDGKPALLFGPFAGFTTKFLKEGSKWDLFGSVKGNNLAPMMSVGANNMDLTRYLIGEVFQTQEERVAALRNFFPEAKEEDWKLAHAGQRVQIIKKDENGKGKLEFGTELVASGDGTLAALLGASPGASTAVQAMIDVIERCFKDKIEKPEWEQKMKLMIPSYGKSLIDDVELLASIRQRTLTTLGLNAQD